MWKQKAQWRVQFLRDHFLAGLMVVLPIAVIVWIALAGMQALWRVHFLLPQSWRPEVFLGHPVLAGILNFIIVVGLTTGMGVGISLLGWSSKQYLGEQILNWLGEQIQRIPLIRTIYSALDQLLRAFTRGGAQQFHRVVYVEYPRKGCWALAFVTGPVQRPPVPAPEGTRFLNLYVPTTPNPTSGFHLMVPEEEVRDTQMKVEEAFKTIISLGIAQSSSGDSAGILRR